jgi:hypothetical protein
MRTCPRCGYEDPFCWRQNRWVSDVSYSRIEDFGAEYPEMADLQPGETRSDTCNYYYRRRKQRAFVYRWSKALGPQYYPSTRQLFERHVPRTPPIKGQKTLVAAPTPGAF